MTSPTTAVPRRRRGGFGDMIRTTVIFAILIVGAVALLPKGHHKDSPAQAVDYAGELQIVSKRAPFHVVAPRGLDAAWTPTHVTIAVPQDGSTTTTFDLGFYVPQPAAYVHLGQSDAPNWVASQLGKSARQTGTTSVTTSVGTVVSYDSWIDTEEHPALVRAEGTSIVVVNGQATIEQLRTFAAALS